MKKIAANTCVQCQKMTQCVAVQSVWLGNGDLISVQSVAGGELKKIGLDTGKLIVNTIGIVMVIAALSIMVVATK